MKKKLAIFIGILALVFAVGYNSLASETPKQEINQQWKFTDQTVDRIALLGAQQSVQVEVIETNSEETVVELSGKVSDSAKEEIEKAAIKDGTLEIALSQGFGLIVTNSGKAPLKLKIYTNLTNPFKKLEIDMLMGDVTVKVPETYEGTYDVKAKKEENILAVPQTSKTMDSKISIVTDETITIEK